jgi:hypothetical protein
MTYPPVDAEEVRDTKKSNKNSGQKGSKEFEMREPG